MGRKKKDNLDNSESENYESINEPKKQSMCNNDQMFKYQNINMVTIRSYWQCQSTIFIWKYMSKLEWLATRISYLFDIYVIIYCLFFSQPEIRVYYLVSGLE
jgi:hypothetical protein|uniref:Uncharacterized protein n=1 Tax=Sipha flava TaxID=143950 RepID=A0A2S2RA17_9HEMI